MNRLLPTVLLAALLTAGAVPAAGARTWTAKVVDVNDGDTIDVDIDGDRSHRVESIRVIGVQAMEENRDNPHKHTPECHAMAAANRMSQLMRQGHRRVQLGAEGAGKRDVRGRLLRTVAIRVGGRWRDVGVKLIREGHALWMPTLLAGTNAAYNRAEQEARQAGRRMWNPVQCGRGPGQDVPLSVRVQSDPVGVDTANINGEWVKVTNMSATRSIRLDHWWLRDSMLRRFTFPRGTTLQPGATATLHVGSGTRSGLTFYWGQPQTVFENASSGLGDGAYLFDPQSDLRAAMVYPCVVACTDPNQGALKIQAHPRAPESVRVSNVSTHDVSLMGYELALRGSAWTLPDDAVLHPGEWLDVDVRQWDNGRYMLVDSGGSIRLTTLDDITIDCNAWGSGTC